MRVQEVLTDLGMKMCTTENALFYLAEERMEGILVVHVDDMLFAGTESFMSKIITPFKQKFKISKEEMRCFKYVGINIEQSRKNDISLDQKEYIQGMTVDILPAARTTDKSRNATEEETKLFRQAVGTLGWVSSITRPEFSFAFCVMGSVQSKPKMSDFVFYKKTVKELKNNPIQIKISGLQMDRARLVVYSDASLGNRTDSASQLGYIIFLADDRQTAVPLVWASKKSKRVARSTLTAETLAASEAVDSATLLKEVIREVIGLKLPPIELRVDNKSLYDAVRTTNTLAEKRLMIDMSALRQMCDRKEVEVKWIAAKYQLADVFTKEGSDKRKLMEVIESGCLPEVSDT